MRLKYYILLIILPLFCGRLWAQVNKAKQLYYHVSEKDGLADNMVNCFFQDSQGIMWMGTQNGLNRFDGSELKTWRPGDQPSNDQLLSGQVNAITEDAMHRIWMATSNGLSVIDPGTEKIHSWQYDGDNRMRSLAVDGVKLWIATGDGLLLFDTRQKTFRHFLNETAGKSTNTSRLNNECNALLLDSKKRLWLATVNGLWLFDTTKLTYGQYDGPKNDPQYDGMVNTIFEDHDGKIWTGCWSGGLKQVIPENRTVINFSGLAGIPAHIMSIVEQRDENKQYHLWLSEYLTEFNQKDLKTEQHDLKPIPEAASLEPRCVYVSRDNLLWISTVKGVFILDPKRQIFKHYFIAGQNSITNQNPALLEQNGRLWMGGDTKLQLEVFDDKFHLLKNYTRAIQNTTGFNEPGIAIMNITPYRQNILLLATTSGILKLDTKTDRITALCKTVGDSTKKISGFINNVLSTRYGLWCFPWRRGIWRFDSTANKFKPLIETLPDAYGKPKGVNVEDAVSDSRGNIWLTDLDYGVVKYDASTKKFQRIVNKDITPYSRAVNIIYIKNNLWLIDNDAVVAINALTGKTNSWPLPAGMNKHVYYYTDDRNGNIWIASRTGLVVFNTANHSFNQYTEEDGLINNDMDGTIKKASGGLMVYAGENYITSFKPTELLRTPAKKKLLLTGIIADDTSLNVSSLKNIIVPAGIEKVTFKWALLNYTNPLQNRYYNKLEKIDKEWNYTGNKGHIEYNHLPPGHYIFRYKAVTADGLAGDEKSVAFTIAPKFYQTVWFICLLIFLLVLSLLLIIRSVRLREQKKSALQLQLSALEMKALRAQMNPHFIFNALNSIQECIITKNTDTAYAYLSNFSKLVRMILENSEKQFITLADEIETLRLYLSIEKLRFDSSFEYRIDIGPKLDTSFVNIPAMIIQPFVENALWHGLIRKKGEKKLTLCFDQKNGNLECIITDNGVGRNLAAEVNTNTQIKKHSMGVKITEERLQLLEKEASITINDLKDANGDACGTEVIIIIPLEF
ncbi:sensor histidine kinase [Mucilaginibacter gotjawali]|uniref:Ligand-binding sensor domain-containing protein n=2 Tax=Mucilaginibacter gotjawali TaxID=1550579 RepID=A0A839SFP9_9SPHI|nr:sensor histidine kinase [Mucilaginibacter gotjawali]MBB3056626.1 ligand-binding sensor domain-containing protein [Mucilaginibacter gotjawali]BAU52671.1 Sensor histidine kinase YehU [Mucilaginibacter gotjawali]